MRPTMTPGRSCVVDSTPMTGTFNSSSVTRSADSADAYVYAFAIALDQKYDAVVEIDADLSHDPAILPTMLDLTRRGIDVVIGSRYVPGGSVVGWPRRRTWLSRWGNRYAAIALGLAINDATAGYRVYRTETLRRNRPWSDPGRRVRLPDRDDLPCHRCRLQHRRGAGHVSATESLDPPR